jgi:dihydroorotase-like cyclic amidohydrolase
MSSLLLRQVRVVPLDGAPTADPVDVLIEDGRIAEVGPAVSAHRVPAVAGEGRWLIHPLAADAARLRAVRADLTCVAGQVVHGELNR